LLHPPRGRPLHIKEKEAGCLGGEKKRGDKPCGPAETGKEKGAIYKKARPPVHPIKKRDRISPERGRRKTTFNCLNHEGNGEKKGGGNVRFRATRFSDGGPGKRGEVSAAISGGKKIVAAQVYFWGGRRKEGDSSTC